MTLFASKTGVPTLVAHRGVSHGYPENTCVAFEAALDPAIDAIELDLQLSKDGVPVVFHDATLSRIGAGRRRIRDMTLRELGDLDAGGWFASRFRGEPIPTLSTVLDRYGRAKPMLLEIKAGSRKSEQALNRRLAMATVAEVRRARLVGRVFVLSFDAEVLEVVGTAEPKLRLVRNFAVRTRLSDAVRKEISGLDAVCLAVRTVTPGFVEVVHRLERPVLVYTCNTKRTVDRALASGVDAIISDNPLWVAEYLEKKSAVRET